MKKTIILLLLFLVTGTALTHAQETYFGQNKVQYRDFSWQYIQSDHFDIYFYDNQYDLAKFTAQELENAYQIVSKQLKYYVRSRIPVFIYNSHNDFQQTNIITEEPSEGTQGFTEVFKKRIVVHFMGSYEDFRHLLHHELTHAVIYDYLYGEFFKAILNPNRLFSLPLWFAEGYAEYSSRGGWSQDADMMVRDATIHEYLQPLEQMEYLSYTEGYALVKYIVDTYGIDKLSEILRKGKSLLMMDKALKSAIGMDSEELYKKFSKEMRKRYWPDISLRQEPIDFAKQMTNHEKDGSHYNEKPVFHPKGSMLAMFTDRGGYSEIFLISALDGKKIARLVKGERSADLESLRWYTSGMSFSPDGDLLVFVSKSKGEDALNFYSLSKRKIVNRKKFGLKSIISPAWSPDGKSIVFSALSGSARDLFMYDLVNESLTRLTNDRFDDIDVAWFPDGQSIVFSSDRPHPDNFTTEDTTAFSYGNYNLQRMEIASRTITPLPVGTGTNQEPAVSPDGKRIAFVSGRNGIDNIYIYNIDSSSVVAVTNCLTDAKSPTWSPDGKTLAFSTFFKAGYDIYLMKDIVAKGDNGILAATDFALGKYDNPVEWARPKKEIAVSDTADTVIVSDSVISTVVSDSVVTPEPRAEKAKPDSEEEYVYHAPIDSSVFAVEDNLSDDTSHTKKIPAEIIDSIGADSLDNLLPTGEYRVNPYRTKFTPDIISGGLQYNSFFGLQGQTIFVFSDYLGNHQIIIATDLVNTIDQSNVQFYYLYNRLRVDFIMGLFHTKNYYTDTYDDLFSDRFYGAFTGLSWPRSKFSRLDFNVAAYFVDRKYYDAPWHSNRNVRVSTATLSWTDDTVLWGITGPINGTRYKLSIEGAVPIMGEGSIKYYAGEFDYRRYFPLIRPISLATRFSGGISGGPMPKSYYLGGNTNYIGKVSVDQQVYNIENLYFSRVVTPLRGYDYYELVGTRYAVSNLELHFPFIDYFVMRYPLQLVLSQIEGALFLDMGATWSEHDTFKGATSQGGSHLVGIKSGFGFGARANLGFLILRYDMAWRTNFSTVEPHTKHYFSLGADF